MEEEYNDEMPMFDTDMSDYERLMFGLDMQGVPFEELDGIDFGGEKFPITYDKVVYFELPNTDEVRGEKHYEFFNEDNSFAGTLIELV